MFSLSGPFELLFLLCFIASWSCGECNVISCIICVSLLKDLFVLCVVCM